VDAGAVRSASQLAAYPVIVWLCRASPCVRPRPSFLLRMPLRRWSALSPTRWIEPASPQRGGD